MTRSRTILLLGLILSMGAARADDASPDEDATGSVSRWGLGVAGESAPRPYRGDSASTRFIPLLTYENAWLRVRGVGADLKLADVGDLSLAVHGEYGMRDGYTSSDADIFSGMATRKSDFWLGPSLRWRGCVGVVSSEFLSDASGNSKGQQARVAFEKTFEAGAVSIVPRIGLTWQSADFVNYYYGVSDAEATTWRPSYRGTSTGNVDVGLRLDYQPTPRQRLTSEFGLRHYGHGIAASPLVDKRTTPLFRVGYLYLF